VQGIDRDCVAAGRDNRLPGLKVGMVFGCHLFSWSHLRHSHATHPTTTTFITTSLRTCDPLPAGMGLPKIRDDQRLHKSCSQLVSLVDDRHFHVTHRPRTVVHIGQRESCPQRDRKRQRRCKTMTKTMSGSPLIVHPPARSTHTTHCIRPSYSVGGG
jgi:hypothetical protein